MGDQQCTDVTITTTNRIACAGWMIVLFAIRRATIAAAKVGESLVAIGIAMIQSMAHTTAKAKSARAVTGQAKRRTARFGKSDERLGSHGRRV